MSVKNNNDMITLLKCTSNYPAKIQDANLKTLIDMKSKFDMILEFQIIPLGYCSNYCSWIGYFSY